MTFSSKWIGITCVAVGLAACNGGDKAGEDQSHLAWTDTDECGCAGAPGTGGSGTGGAPSAGCTLTQGFWKNHPGAWPVASLDLGGVTYSEAELIAILQTPPKNGDASLILAHQLIAAKLNVLSGASTTADVAAAIADADAWLAAHADADGKLPFGVKDGQATSLASTLDSFNSGDIGPGHCDEGPSTTSAATTGAGGASSAATTGAGGAPTTTSASAGGAGGCGGAPTDTSASSTGGWARTPQ